MDDALMADINAMVDDKGHAPVRARCARMLERGCSPVYVGYAVAKRAGCEAFKENLDVLDGRLPQLIERLLWNRFFRGEDNNDIAAAVDRVVAENPIGVTRPEVKYPYMMKSFLCAAYCGLTASTLWDGEARVNGGFITVDEDGSVLANYALESEEFKSYLYKNCYFDDPSTGAKHGDYGYVYREGSDYFFKLNFQIRYR